MRKLIYFALLVMVIPLFAACKKSISTGSQENFEHYIFFGHQVESKASLINGKDDVQSFGVVGFKYDNTTSWDEYKTKTECTPNVFFDETNSPVDVETLNCTKGSPSYTPLQGWSNTREYTFFAFYPIGNENVDIVSANGSEYKGGVPAIKYSLNTEHLQGSMVDVMVSEPCKDLYYNSSEDNNLQGGEVKLKFNHILSALGVNFTRETENTITIKGVSMTISGIQYQTYIYPLDGVADDIPGGPAMDEKSFALSIPEGVEVVSESAGIEIAGTEIADKLIFIPQSEKATISLTINYTRSAGDVSINDVKSFIDIKTAFEAGKKHLIQLKFTDSTVKVESDVTSGAWTDVEDVNNTFN